MRTRTMLVAVIGAAVLGTVSLVAYAQDHQEQSTTIDKVPAAVRATILKETAGGQIKEIEAETHNGRTIYEVEFVREGKTSEIAIGADGALLTRGGDEDEDDGKNERDDEDEHKGAKAEEQERKVTADEVPAAALATLRRLANGAKFTEFAEEIEHGGKFYEGSWKGAGGTNIDALVTAAGDLVELEEEVKSESVPSAVLSAVKKLAGADGTLFCEKKTMILYEVKFRKGTDRHEILYTPDGRTVESDVERGAGDRDD